MRTSIKKLAHCGNNSLIPLSIKIQNLERLLPFYHWDGKKESMTRHAHFYAWCSWDLEPKFKRQLSKLSSIVWRLKLPKRGIVTLYAFICVCHCLHYLKICNRTEENRIGKKKLQKTSSYFFCSPLIQNFEILIVHLNALFHAQLKLMFPMHFAWIRL